jgi:hypothetical protein
VQERRVYLAAAVFAVLSVTSFGATLAGATPLRATAGPGGKEPGDCTPESTQVKGGAPVHGGGSICGSRFDDTLRSKKGHPIWGYPGKDLISARNGKVDEIRGGPGKDTAIVDSKDTVWGDVEKCLPYVRCPGSRAQPKRLAVSQVQFFKEEPIVVCDLEPGTENRRLWVAMEPRMRAADTTNRVDWQTVAYRAILYRHDGTDWRVRGQSTWLFDRTFDPSERATEFHGNFWRHLRTKQRQQVINFYADEAGVYRVSVKYYWYRTRSVAEHEVEDVVDYHFGEFETNNRHESCTFPY